MRTSSRRRNGFSRSSSLVSQTSLPATGLTPAPRAPL
ncbi:Uncharacterised protein [Bordetella pertussis]|nr:Uncharacterised protein [Bordetella pertussis]CFP58264.1 Uncharacterised protein [Bordetella pertussis]